MTTHRRSADADPAWTSEDENAVLAIYRELRAEQPSLSHGTAWGKAARSYYSRTSRVSAHNQTGYVYGCRCPLCRLAAAEYREKHAVVTP